MFYIRNEKDAKSSLSPDQHLAFVKQCEVHIAELKSKGQLIAAQPIVHQGMLIRKNGNDWVQNDVSNDKETQVGYYHILASDLNEAVEIAKKNPEFAYVASASIEVRPIKTKEKETGFVYPKGN
jgi:hypothetical protein